MEKAELTQLIFAALIAKVESPFAPNEQDVKRCLTAAVEWKRIVDAQKTEPAYQAFFV